MLSAEWQVPELGSWQRRLQQGFAKQDAQLEHVQQRIQSASTRALQLEEGEQRVWRPHTRCLHDRLPNEAPTLFTSNHPITEDRRLRREIEIREEVLQEAAERIMHLRVRNEQIAKKNQEVAEAEKRQLASKDRERADYIARLRTQTAQNWASRQASRAAAREGNRAAMRGQGVVCCGLSPLSLDAHRRCRP